MYLVVAADYYCYISIAMQNQFVIIADSKYSNIVDLFTKLFLTNEKLFNKVFYHLYNNLFLNIIFVNNLLFIIYIKKYYASRLFL